jgi:hypothetical protein
VVEERPQLALVRDIRSEGAGDAGGGRDRRDDVPLPSTLVVASSPGQLSKREFLM